MAEEAKKVFGVPAKAVFAILLIILTVPSAFFIWTSYRQLELILADIANSPVSAIPDHLLSSTPPQPAAAAAQAAIFLEHQVILQRQHRANALLATRTWMRFMSLIFGAVLVVIGSAFVLGRITSSAEGKVGVGTFTASLVSTSPGLFAIAFGTALIAIPNLATQQISVNEGAIYVTAIRPAVPAPAVPEDLRKAAIAEILGTRESTE